MSSTKYFTNIEVNNEKIYVMDERVVNDIEGDVTTTILGTFTTDLNHLPSSCVKIGDLLYILNAPTADYANANSTNAGELQCFDMLSNSCVSDKEKTIAMGHANSVCYDGTYVYIAPVWDHSGGESANASYIYRYDKLFSTVAYITIPQTLIDAGTTIMAVSCDNGVVYAYAYNGDIYYIDSTGSFKFFKHLVQPDNGKYGNSSYIQDFTMHDGVVQLSSGEGSIATFTLSPDDTYVIKSAVNLSALDSEASFWMGELEGMEYTSDGHLIAVRYTLTSSNRYGFIVEIPSGVPMYIPRSASVSKTNNTFTISDTVKSTFKNPIYQIKSVSALQCCYEKPNRLNIENSHTENNAIITIPLTITTGSDAIFTFDQLQCWGGMLTLTSGNFNATSNVCIRVERGGTLMLNSDAVITSDQASAQLVATGYNCMSILKYTSIDSKFTIDGVAYQGAGLYIAGNRYASRQCGETSALSLSTGGITTGTINFEYPFRQTPIVIVGFKTASGATAFAQCSVTAASITTTGFQYRVYNPTSTSYGPVVEWVAFEKNML